MTDNKNHLDFLDGMRGFLALWVLVSHILMTTAAKNTPWGSGAIAVDIFMLLSGSLMAYHWILREERFSDFKTQTFDFYIRRFFRIAPLYYILLVCSYVFHDLIFEMREQIQVIVPPPWLDDIAPDRLVRPERSLSDFILHITFLFGFLPEYLGTNLMPDWSIGLEMQFYLILPFLIVMLRYIGPLSLIVFLLALSYMTNKLIGLYLDEKILGNFPQPSLILFKINIFAAGMSIALFLLAKEPPEKIMWCLLVVLSLLTAKVQVWGASFLMMYFFFFRDYKMGDFIYSILSSKAARFLGDTSYAVYLLHFMIFIPVAYYLFQHSWFIEMNGYIRFSIVFTLSSVPLYITAYFLYKYVEVPGINMGRHISRKFVN